MKQPLCTGPLPLDGFNRREFLRTLFTGVAGVIATQIDIDKSIELALAKTNHMEDRDFVIYITWSMNLLVNNPAQSMIISNIRDDSNSRSNA